MAAVAVESPGVYEESMHDQEDVVYPCKGCGEVRDTNATQARSTWRLTGVSCRADTGRRQSI